MYKRSLGDLLSAPMHTTNISMAANRHTVKKGGAAHPAIVTHMPSHAKKEVEMIQVTAVFLLISALSMTIAFRPIGNRQIHGMMLRMSDEAPAFIADEPEGAAPTSKGFGSKKTVVGEDKEVEESAGDRTYASQAKRGVPEYNIFIKTAGGGEEEWVPVGSMTIPRDVTVSKAVFEVEGELLKGTFKLYPKMKPFWETRDEETRKTVFEYGYCLKAFPDEEIKKCSRDDTEVKQGNFFQNWLNQVTNPTDTSQLNNPGQMTLNQNK